MQYIEKELNIGTTPTSCAWCLIFTDEPSISFRVKDWCNNFKEKTELGHFNINYQQI